MNESNENFPLYDMVCARQASNSGHLVYYWYYVVGVFHQRKVQHTIIAIEYLLMGPIPYLLTIWVGDESDKFFSPD